MDAHKNAESTEPTVNMSDVTQPPFPADRQPWQPSRTYLAEAIQGDIKAIIEFRWYPGNPKGFVMDRRVARSNKFAYGSMGRKQEERAKALFPALEEQMRHALEAAGWRVIGKTVFEVAIWYYFGAAIEE